MTPSNNLQENVFQKPTNCKISNASLKPIKSREYAKKVSALYANEQRVRNHFHDVARFLGMLEPCFNIF